VSGLFSPTDTLPQQLTPPLGLSFSEPPKSIGVQRGEPGFFDFNATICIELKFPATSVHDRNHLYLDQKVQTKSFSRIKK
jgi:hypothetical protein